MTSHGVEHTPQGGAARAGLALRSEAFSDHDFIPERYALDGGNTAPPLEWDAPPEGTVEFALLCEDPDAPGGPFTHWVVTAIPARTRAIPEGRLPKGAAFGRNDFGELGWSGPRPPAGEKAHRYFFRLYALDRALGLDAGAIGAELRAAVADCSLAHGTLVGLFAR
jgi:Raf kinase inhibitor-like YbhB/YbcL family protein